METWQLKSPVVLGAWGWVKKQKDEQIGGGPKTWSQQELLAGGGSEPRHWALVRRAVSVKVWE